MDMPNIKDQLGKIIAIPQTINTIVSLVPSQTELLHDLEVWDKVIGVTRFCVHPKDARKVKTVIGGTKDPKLDKIKVLKPDLVIANKEENRKEDIEALAAEIPVWVSDVSDLGSSLDMIRTVGQITGATGIADRMVTELQTSFGHIHKAQGETVLYLIWRKPWMAVGRGTFIDDMLQRCGFQNILEKPRYPEISAASFTELNPDRILLSSEPYPFREKQVAEVQALCPEAKVQLVDGELFSWYGSRLLKSVEYFNQLVAG
jgi:ABC-type Fe3+-hydroxamate transport system substrate-binding protein